MSNESASIYLLAGVTAAGKSRIALQLRLNPNEVIFCHAIRSQFIKGWTSSAKPSADEQSRVFHHGIDLAEVDSVYTVADYAVYVKQVIEKLLNEDKKFLIVGGSGFYLQVFSVSCRR